MNPADPIVHAAKIIMIAPAPGRLEDEHGNIYAGFALVEFDIDWGDGREVSREIVPFGSDGGLIGLPSDAYYLAHALGDHRPPYASFVEPDRVAA